MLLPVAVADREGIEGSCHAKHGLSSLPTIDQNAMRTRRANRAIQLVGGASSLSRSAVESSQVLRAMMKYKSASPAAAGKPDTMMVDSPSRARPRGSSFCDPRVK